MLLTQLKKAQLIYLISKSSALETCLKLKVIKHNSSLTDMFIQHFSIWHLKVQFVKKAYLVNVINVSSDSRLWWLNGASKQ